MFHALKVSPKQVTAIQVFKKYLSFSEIQFKVGKSTQTGLTLGTGSVLIFGPWVFCWDLCDIVIGVDPETS